MYKTNNESLARTLAAEHGLSYGMSVLGGGWYAGTAEQLGKIGVVDIKRPSAWDAIPARREAREAVSPEYRALRRGDTVEVERWWDEIQLSTGE